MLKSYFLLGLLPLAVAAMAPVRDVAKAKDGPSLRVQSFTVLVKDHDEALRWYTEVLGLEKRADNSETMPGFRWLTVGPAGQKDIEIVLLLAGEEQKARVGKGTQVVLTTNDCKKTFAALSGRGVEFSGGVEEMPWGTTANFVDLYGNPYHLMQPAGR